MTVAETMETKLREALTPSRLEIRNDSWKHAGHSSSPGTGESHFHVTVVSPSFQGQSRVARHRMVYRILAEELAGPVHALAVDALAPGEE